VKVTLLCSEVLRKVIPAIYDLQEKNTRCKTGNPVDVTASKAPNMYLINLVFSRISVTKRRGKKYLKRKQITFSALFRLSYCFSFRHNY
jgi:hypothetical protein